MRVILTSLLASSYIMAAGFSTSSLLDGSFQEVGLSISKGKADTKNITGFYEYSLLMGAGLRFEYSKNINEFSEFSSADISKYGMFAVYNLSLPGTSFSITPKAGMVKTDGEFETLDAIKKVTSKETKFTYGVEINYDINNRASLFLGYTDYGNNIKSKKDIKLDNLDGKNVALGFKVKL
jgi:hypothetical protein